MGLLTKIFGAKTPEVTEDIRVYTELNRDDSVNDFFLAGVQHHCTRKDVGFFTGVVYNDKGNSYDKNAMAVGSHQTNKVLGYVPASILDDYRSWCGKKNCTCVGYLFFDGEMVRGRVRAYLPGLDQDKVMADIKDYAGQVCEHFNWTVPTFEA